MHPLSSRIFTGHQSILVAEDHDDTREMLKLVLSMQDLKVFEARDGQEAYDFAIKECPDLILMDFTLPHMDGVTVTRKIRLNDRIGRTPIVFLSGSAEPMRLKAAYDAGCNDFVIKPVDVDEVLKIVRRYLEPPTSVRTANNQ